MTLVLGLETLVLGLETLVLGLSDSGVRSSDSGVSLSDSGVSVRRHVPAQAPPSGWFPFPIPPIPGWDPDSTPWDDTLYPPLNQGPKELQRHRGKPTVVLTSDSPALNGSSVSFTAKLQYPPCQKEDADGELLWDEHCEDGTELEASANGQVRSGYVYNWTSWLEDYGYGACLDTNRCNVFPDGKPFPQSNDWRHKNYVYVWHTRGQYYETCDGSSSSLSLNTSTFLWEQKSWRCWFTGRERGESNINHITGNIYHITSNINYITSNIYHITGNINHITGNIYHITSNIYHITGNIYHITGNIYHITSNIYHITGNIYHITGNIYHITGNVYYITGNINHITGNIYHVTSNVYHITGNIYHITGNVHYITGNINHITGNIYHVTSNVYHITGNIYHIPENIYHITGNIYHITENIYHITGNIYHITGNIYHVTSNIYHITGNIYHITGNIYHITGNIYHITGNIYHITGNVYHITGNKDNTTGNMYHITGNVYHITGNIYHTTGSMYHITGNNYNITGNIYHITDKIPVSASLSQKSAVNMSDGVFFQGEELLFQVRLHDPSEYLKTASSVDFLWDFRDGNQLVTHRDTITHTYSSPGKRSVKLVVEAAFPVECPPSAATPTPHVPSAAPTRQPGGSTVNPGTHALTIKIDTTQAPRRTSTPLPPQPPSTSFSSFSTSPLFSTEPLPPTLTPTAEDFSTTTGPWLHRHPANANQCFHYVHGSFTANITIVEPKPAVRSWPNNKIIDVTAARETKTDISFLVKCQGSSPTSACTIVSDPSCSEVLSILCDDLPPSAECLVHLRRSFPEPGTYCVNITLEDSRSMGLASTTVTINKAQESPALQRPHTAEVVVSSSMALTALFAFVAFMVYRRYRVYRPIRRILVDDALSPGRVRSRMTSYKQEQDLNTRRKKEEEEEEEKEEGELEEDGGREAREEGGGERGGEEEGQLEEEGGGGEEEEEDGGGGEAREGEEGGGERGGGEEEGEQLEEEGGGEEEGEQLEEEGGGEGELEEEKKKEKKDEEKEEEKKKKEENKKKKKEN
ncbi:hypothetical protein WMY93_028856 [Mugilogobius chulae]|uniref:PKD domain-containing protein n=1 Tax=Mugilogobius chulae TaxID=88201 RepID=A0AAW0MPK2_9GOBI